MSQPGNYQYQPYADSPGSLKSGQPPMVNGEPSAIPRTQNGVQPSFYSGTPSSQSSREPSREASRDPSPTQYLHNQYRPQLPRPPMPPINGSQPSLSHVPMSLQSRGLPPRQPAPGANPQQSSQFGHVQSGNAAAYAPPTSHAAPPSNPSQSLSADSQSGAGNKSQRTITPTKYDFPSPQRSTPGNPDSQTSTADGQTARPSPTVSQAGLSSGGQHLPNPPTDQNLLQSQSQSNWRKETSFPSSTLNAPNPAPPPATNPNQTWRNPAVDPNSNISQTISQPYSGQSALQSQPSPLPPSSMDKEGPSAAANTSSSTSTVPVQTWRNPNADSNSNSRTTSHPYPDTHQSVAPPPMSQPQQNTNFGPPPVSGTRTQNMPSYFQQSQQQLSSGNKGNLISAGSNVRGPQVIGTQASTTVMPALNSSSQNLFATPVNQHPPLANQGFNQKLPGAQMLHPSLPNPQAQYPPTQQNTFANQQPSLSGPGTTSQPNRGTYASQQNVTSQRKYPQAAYGTQQLPQGGPNVAGPPMGPPKNAAISPMVPGQIPMRPPGPGAPPLPGQTSAVSPSGPGQMPMRPPGPGAPPLPGQQPQSQYDNRSPYFGQMSNVPLDNMANRYPAPSYPDQMNQMNTQMGNLNVTQSGFNELWGQQSVDLLQCRNVLPPEKVEPPKIKLHQEFLDSVNCSSDIFRCTLTKIPESNSLLQKCRLPLGVLIHPFKDLNHLPVIQCSTIVRCRACRTYINPFVYFVDSKRWKCNLCYRVNELPEEFQFDPVTKLYGDPSRRPEVKTSTIEFIAPSEYMLRPPQPAVYLFLLDVSRLAVETGYLSVVCETIAEELTKLPGDGRTQVGFIAIDSAVHYFSMPENVSQPHELIMLDVDDVFLPCPDNLIVNLKEREELIRDLLAQLPTKFNGTHDTNSALGAGLQAAFKLMSPTGGRVTVFQTCLPNLGPGALQPREDPNSRASKDVPHLNPATDFYKRLALDCSGQQIAVDLFLLNSQYSDLATLSGMCKFSGGCMYHIPLFRTNKPQHSETLEKMLRRYLTRKIGFEAVMRIRCTRGLSIHTFHGNFFVRSTDLLSLPNVNPDAGFGMQVSIEENLSDVQSVCFQAALLYTSSKGERRIRVHTLCLPVSSSMSDILYSADQQGMVGLLSKMAVDRSQQSSLSDARDALINVAIDVLSAYKLSQSAATGGLLAPGNLKLLPLYIIALIKCVAFRSGTSTRLDDRVYAMCQMKALPLFQLMQMVYPDLYPVHALDDNNSKDIDGKVCPQPPRLHLSAEKLDFRGVFLMDAGDQIYIYVGKSVDPMFCNNVFGVQAFTSIPEEFYDLPELDTVESERLRNFVFSLQEEKPYYASLQIIRDDSHFRNLFTDRLIEDRFENALSYHEFLQHLKTQVK